MILFFNKPGWDFINVVVPLLISKPLIVFSGSITPPLTAANLKASSETAERQLSMYL
ncbi:MAG: hypothetical protein ACOCQG_02090 [Candidatus Nanoarchaeia archaeon]